ncbi:hypothetical protein [Treponema zioleckii]|uniref:hypothetical protein n=1 Tax=Treponema zioleckii TaxID=331680 RepID=UPI00168B7D78|nr:hypothetical protein [Treponema zioleckii]
MSKKQEFINWCIKEGKMRPGPANCYTTYLNKVSEILELKKGFHISYFSDFTECDLEKTATSLKYLDEIMENKDFKEVKHPERLGNYRCAINKYMAFVKEVPFWAVHKPVFVLNKKINVENAKQVVDSSALNKLFGIYWQELFPSYKISGAVKPDLLGAKYLEKNNELLVVVLEARKVSAESYEKTVKAMQNDKKNKRTEG